MFILQLFVGISSVISFRAKVKTLAISQNVAVIAFWEQHQMRCGESVVVRAYVEQFSCYCRISHLPFVPKKAGKGMNE